MSRRYNTKEFIAKAQAVHGNKYDYSRVVYVDSVTPVSIVCPEHGEFKQRPAVHLSGRGCPGCGRLAVSKALSDNLESFLEKARKVHGDKYDYSLVDYKGSEVPVRIICPIHGEFLQRPHTHLLGSECSACGRIKCDNSRKKGLDIFLEQAHSVHGDRYDYSKVDLVTRRKKVCIICREHGEFWQEPYNHVQGQGCPTCARKFVGQKNNKDTEWFLEKARAIHGDRYDYSETVYVKASEKVCVICHEKDDGGYEHGRFWLTPHAHLTHTGGCPKCGHPKHTIEWFLEQARSVHGNTYDYSQAEYVNAQTPLTVICREHGPFQIYLYSHLRGVGCPKCDGRNWTTEDFIKEARAIHGDKYEYDKVEYVNKTTPVTITCPVHGDFEQTPANHLRGNGCIQCHIDSRTTDLDTFIARAREVHGDKYDYSKAVYVNSGTKICVICPDHGEFWSIPNNHLRGAGCAACVGKQKKDTDLFIKEARGIHGDKYDYSKVEYKTNKDKVCIICPEHGEFWQQPAGHLKGAGCPDCSGLKPITVDVFKERSALAHDNKFDYSKVQFERVSEKVCIICPEHGEFWQTARDHMNGYSCPKCSGRYMDTEYFKEKATKVHNGKYDYSKVVFNGAFEKVRIICPIHGEYEQVASYHLAGNGCPSCNERQLEKDVRALLKKNHIKFVAQKTFDWLVFNGKMFLDFYLPDYGVVIECQGLQHFEAIEYFGGEDGFSRTKMRDETKKTQCEKHGLKMIYYSDLGIEYPYPVFEDKGMLLKAIYSNGDFDPSVLNDPELPLNW